METMLRIELIIFLISNDSWFDIPTTKHTWTTHFDTRSFSTTCRHPGSRNSSTVTNQVTVFNNSLQHTISPNILKSWIDWFKSNPFRHSLKNPKIIAVTKAYGQHLQANGIDQWDENYPDRASIEHDISTNTLYVYQEQDIILGLVVLNESQDDEYNQINWLTTTPPN